MKLILPLLLPILLSCSDISVYFENTQPLDGKVLKEFPKKFRNKYKKGIRTAEFTNDQYILIENFQKTQSSPVAVLEPSPHEKYCRAELKIGDHVNNTRLFAAPVRMNRNNMNHRNLYF